MQKKSTHYKIVLLGDSAVGKSCLASRFIGQDFLEFQEPTIGAAFLTKSMIFNDDQFKFDIWDTAGQERYRSLAPMYYRGAHVAIVVYDITDLSSFNSAKVWIEEIKRRTDESLILLLLGNKKDLEKRRKVSCELVNDYVNDSKNITHLETSAKTNENIDNLFDIICNKLPKNLKDNNYDNRLNLETRRTFKKKCYFF